MFEDLQLFGRENFRQLILRLFLKIGELLVLLFRESKLFNHKARKDMEPATTRRAAATVARRWAIGTRRRIGGK